MRLLKKLVIIITGLLLMVIISAGSYALLRKDHLAAAFIKKINETINTKISYGSLRITIFESFPSITIVFSDLLISPSPYYDRAEFGSYDSDTLFYASSLSLTAYTPSLLRGTVAIRSVTAREGVLNLLTDKRGDINYEVISGSGGGDTDIRLKAISIKNVRTLWYDKSSEVRAQGMLSEASVNGSIFNTDIFLSGTLMADIDTLAIKGMTLAGFPAQTDIRVRKTANSFSIAKGSLILAGLSFDIDGMVNYSMKNLDLKIESRKLDVSSLAGRLPGRARELAEGFNPSGKVDITCLVNGHYGTAGTPHFEVSYMLKEGRMKLDPAGLSLNNLSFSGTMSNGALNAPSTSSVRLDDFSASYGSSDLRGSFSLNNFSAPAVKVRLEGILDFTELSKVISGKGFTGLSGTVSGRAELSGKLPGSSLHGKVLLSSLNPVIELHFSNFGTLTAGKQYSFSDISGDISVSGDLSADSLSLSTSGHRLIADLKLKNFIGWLSGKPGMLEVTGDLRTDRLEPAAFRNTGSDSSGTGQNEPSLFPPDITASINVTADSLVAGDFKVASFSAKVDYKPYIYTFSNAMADGLNGKLSGDLMIGRQNDGTFMSKSHLSVSGVDIYEAFHSFHNFGQDFITSENIRGTLTGNTTILTPLGSDFRINTAALVAEMHLSIINGRLVSFPPAQSLSSYLDLDELSNISFSEMENDIYIRNRTVSVPKMLINSSAGNFTIYGTHNFGGDYSYHIRVLLSEVLSRKARDRNRESAAFGQVKVDDSGKATIPLKIECRGDVTEVKYDFGQAQDNIKENISGEKKTMKGILNEEYGWYKADTTRVRTEELKPKFSITWEEGRDSVRTENTVEEEKESPLKILLRKRK